MTGPWFYCVSKKHLFACIYIFLCLLQDRNGFMDENELDALLKDLCEKNKKVRLYSTSCLKDFVWLQRNSHFWQSQYRIVPTQFQVQTHESVLTSVKIQSPALCVPCIQMCDYSST